VERSHRSSGGAGSEQLQRIFDVIGSLAGLILLSPLLLILVVAIVMFDGRPVLYQATRVGRGGRLFSLYKFRTMNPNADLRGGGITVRDDVRITRVGAILRRFKLDEFPQLLNVAKGDMSLVGPRPEDPRYVALYTPEQRNVLRVRPGITSLASLKFKDESELLRGADWEEKYIGEIMPGKLAMEAEYIQHRTVLKDVKIIVRTLGGVIQCRSG